MRINKFVALATGMSRRAADQAIAAGRIMIDQQPVSAGHMVQQGQTVTLDGDVLNLPLHTQTILLHKPVGFVVSRDGQGSPTVYDLLPPTLHHLKPVGRLDKDSSGLLLLTDDGQLAQMLTHPSHQKDKVYQVTLDKALTRSHEQQLTQGVPLDDGLSQLALTGSGKQWQVTLQEGRNRQIRRTFASLGYNVEKLHRTQFGDYQLNELAPGKFKTA